MMRFAKRFPFAARSWQVMLLALAMCASGLAAAQASVAQTEISGDVLLALLGTGQAIEIGLPSDVRLVHVVVTRGDAMVDNRSTNVEPWSEDQSVSVTLSVGALGPTLRCPLLVFTHTSVTRDGTVSQHGMNSGCIETATPVRLVPRGGFLPTSIDVERWYVVDGFTLMDPTPGADRPTDEQGRRTFDEFVFHVYLSTEDAPAPIEQLGEHAR